MYKCHGKPSKIKHACFSQGLIWIKGEAQDTVTQQLVFKNEQSFWVSSKEKIPKLYHHLFEK